VAALVSNRSSGLDSPFGDASSAAEAEHAARRALGHLMVGASLAGFELPAGVAAPDGEARLAFQVDSLGARWQCALALDGALEVAAAADTDGAFGAVERDTSEEVASLALVDLIAAAGLAWVLSACVVLGRCPDRRRADLVALLVGTCVLALFLATL